MTPSSAMKSHRGVTSTPDGTNAAKDPSIADIKKENGSWDPRERSAMDETPRSKTKLAAENKTPRLSRREARGLAQQAAAGKADKNINGKDVGGGGHGGGETNRSSSLPSLDSAAVLTVAAEGVLENDIPDKTGQESLSDQSDSTLEESVEEDPPERVGMLLGLAEMFAAEVRQAADAEEHERLKISFARANDEAAALRLSLSRAEAAVIGHQQQREAAVAALQSEVTKCRQELQVAQLEAQDHQFRCNMGKAQASALREELKRSQAALMGLSAWDEEKIELELEVSDLKDRLEAAMKQSDERHEKIRREYDLKTAKAGLNTRKQLRREVEQSRKRMEDVLSDEFRERRRQNQSLMKEKEQRNWEMHQLTRTVSRLEAGLLAFRRDLTNERRMHHHAIAKTKRAEAVIRELEKVATHALANNNNRNESSDDHSEQQQQQQQQQQRRQRTTASWEERGGAVESRFIRSTPRSPVCHTKSTTVFSAHNEELESEVLGRGGQEQSSEDAADTDSNEDRQEDGAGGCSEQSEAGRKDDRLCFNCRGPSAAEQLKYKKHELVARTSSTDVWSMLDAYVRRRSGVARAKCHVKAIEAMREHLAKTTTLKPGGQPAHAITTAATTPTAIATATRIAAVIEGRKGETKPSRCNSSNDNNSGGVFARASVDVVASTEASWRASAAATQGARAVVVGNAGGGVARSRRHEGRNSDCNSVDGRRRNKKRGRRGLMSRPDESTKSSMRGGKQQTVDAPPALHCILSDRRPPRVSEEASHGNSVSTLSQVTSIVTSTGMWEGGTKGGEGGRRGSSSPKDTSYTNTRTIKSQHPEATSRHALLPTRRVILPIVQGSQGPRDTSSCVGGEGASGREYGDNRNDLAEPTPRQHGCGSRHTPPVIMATRLKPKATSATGTAPTTAATTTTAAASLPAILPLSCTISTYRNDNHENNSNNGNNDNSNGIGSGGITTKNTDDISTISGCSAVVVRSPSSTTCKAAPAAEAYRNVCNTTHASWGRIAKPRKEAASRVVNYSSGRSRGIHEYSTKGRATERGEGSSPYPPAISSKRNWAGIRGGGVHRRSRRTQMFVKAELSDWIKTNTNLVNVCP